jgi:hypothetical protein
VYHYLETRNIQLHDLDDLHDSVPVPPATSEKMPGCTVTKVNKEENKEENNCLHGEVNYEILKRLARRRNLRVTRQKRVIDMTEEERDAYVRARYKAAGF